MNRACFSKSTTIELSNGLTLEGKTFDDLYNWDNENYREALFAFVENCSKILELPVQYDIFPQINKKINKNDFYSVCKIAHVIRNYNEKYLKVFFESYFVPFEIINKSSNFSLFTGYYLPIIKAKRQKDNIFKYPIYKRPNDLIDGVKYYTRKEISNGALENKNLEILYTDDPVELFFFHIQGSGNIELIDEGQIIAIGYDGKNNHKYTSIGNYLRENNILENLKMDSKSMKRELKKYPKLAESIFNINESYIFFKILENNKFKGAFGSNLIPFRTIAVDKNYIPLGFPLWLNTTHITENEKNDFSKLVIANDTGSAIKGAVRGDIFFGFGENGEENASYQYSTGKYYLLVPQRVLKKISKK